MLAFINNKSTTKWVGPADYARDFAARFHKAGVLQGTDLFWESDEARAEYYVAVARSRSNNLQKDDVKHMKEEDLLLLLLPPGGIARLEEWRVWRDDKFGKQQVVIADLDHHPGCRFTGGTDWPVQLTHGTVCLIGPEKSYMKLATTMEHLQAMGFPCRQVNGNAPTAFPEPAIVDILKQLDMRKQKVVAGNGMHLVTQTAWMLYCLSNVVRLAPDERVSGPSSCPEQDAATPASFGDDDF